MKKHSFIIILITSYFLFNALSCTVNNYYTNPENENSNNNQVTPRDDEILLSFNTNGGTTLNSIAVPKNKQLDLMIQYDGNFTNIVYDGGNIIRPTPGTDTTLLNPTKTGKLFSGWYLNANCTTQVCRQKFTLTENTTFYAKWSDPCVITLDANGGTCSTSNVTVPKGNTVYFYWLANNGLSNCFVDNDLNAYYKIVSAPTKAGSAFAGWYEDINNPNTYFCYPKTFYASGDVTLKAKWVEPCTIQFVTNCSVNMPDIIVPSGMQVYMNVNGTFAHELRIDGNNCLIRISNNEPSFPVWAGHKILGWYKDSAFTEPADGTNGLKFTTTANGTITLYAKWD